MSTDEPNNYTANSPVEGVALARQLVHNGVGVLYGPAGSDELLVAVGDALTMAEQYRYSSPTDLRGDYLAALDDFAAVLENLRVAATQAVTV